MTCLVTLHCGLTHLVAFDSNSTICDLLLAKDTDTTATSRPGPGEGFFSRLHRDGRFEWDVREERITERRATPTACLQSGGSSADEEHAFPC